MSEEERKEKKRKQRLELESGRARRRRSKEGFKNPSSPRYENRVLGLAVLHVFVL